MSQLLKTLRSPHKSVSRPDPSSQSNTRRHETNTSESDQYEFLTDKVEDGLRAPNGNGLRSAREKLSRIASSVRSTSAVYAREMQDLQEASAHLSSRSQPDIESSSAIIARILTEYSRVSQNLSPYQLSLFELIPGYERHLLPTGRSMSTPNPTMSNTSSGMTAPTGRHRFHQPLGPLRPLRAVSTPPENVVGDATIRSQIRSLLSQNKGPQIKSLISAVVARSTWRDGERARRGKEREEETYRARLQYAANATAYGLVGSAIDDLTGIYKSYEGQRDLSAEETDLYGYLRGDSSGAQPSEPNTYIRNQTSGTRGQQTMPTTSGTLGLHQVPAGGGSSPRTQRRQHEFIPRGSQSDHRTQRDRVRNDQGVPISSISGFFGATPRNTGTEMLGRPYGYSARRTEMTHAASSTSYSSLPPAPAADEQLRTGGHSGGFNTDSNQTWLGGAMTGAPSRISSRPGTVTSLAPTGSTSSDSNPFAWGPESSSPRWDRERTTRREDRF